MLEDRVMVPIYMLRDVGAKVSWSGETQSVHVSIDNSPSVDHQYLADVEVFRHLIFLQRELESLLKKYYIFSSSSENDVHTQIEMNSLLINQNLNLALLSNDINEVERNKLEQLHTKFASLQEVLFDSDTNNDNEAFASFKPELDRMIADYDYKLMKSAMKELGKRN
jgi:hypothetical protein